MVAGEHRLTAPPGAKGQRLDQFLAQAIEGLSRSRVTALINQQQVTVSGAPAHAALRLRGGEAICVVVPEPRSAKASAEELPIRVLHEDKDLIVVDKAAGMVVHPAAGNWSGTLVNALLHHVDDLEGVGGELRPGLVHRLDKDTSGCVVVAKNEATLQALQAAFKGREVEKLYLAIVLGEPPDHGVIETLYGRHPRDRKRFTGKVKEGKTAKTEYRTVERFAGAALVEVILHTGRTHQIRVHLSEAGFPLLSDSLYGKRAKKDLAEAEGAMGRQALHAWKLSFKHPRSKRRMAFEAKLHPDFEAALTALRGRRP